MSQAIRRQGGTAPLAIEYDLRSHRVRAVVMSEDVAVAIAFGIAVGIALAALARR